MWLNRLSQELGQNVTKEQLTEFIWKTLNSGQVVPGFGHAVLRKTDPRYMCQREFAFKHLPNDPLFKLVALLFEVRADLAPGVRTRSSSIQLCSLLLGCSRCADSARQDQEPLAERGCPQWSTSPGKASSHVRLHLTVCGILPCSITG